MDILFQPEERGIKFIFIYKNLTFSPLIFYPSIFVCVSRSMNVYNVQNKGILRVDNNIFNNVYSNTKK